jgi:hypothetical protein
MKEASRAFEEALNQQLKTVLESTITEETLNQEMRVAAQAIPPLIMDENRLQLQIRCAAAEEKAEDLRLELQALRERDDEKRIASLQKDLENLRKELTKAQGKQKELSNRNDDILKENLTLRRDNEKLEAKIGKVKTDHLKMKRAALLDENVMVGLKKRVETAKSELERLKRKRTDSIRPERMITGILKRPAIPPPSGQHAAGKDVPSSSA